MRGDQEPLLSLSGLLRRLEYFVVVADELHLGRAAQRCGVSQPTLSHQLKVLEKELGAQLLSRDSRRMSLTPPGRALQEEAPQLLQRTYSIKARIREAAAGPGRPVRVAFSRSGHALRQREMVAEFRARDALPVSVESGWSARNIEQVRAGRVDFAFVRPPIEADDLRMAVVGEVELVELLPGEGASGRTEEDRAAGDLPLIMWPRSLAPGLHDKILTIVGQERSPRGLPPYVAWEEPDYINVAAAVASGAGMSYMDRDIAEWMSLSLDLRMRPLGAPGPRTDVAVVWREDQDPGLASRFVAACCGVGQPGGTEAECGCLVQ
ncbi:LysR family transcriptional regulator [Streptomyces roseoverticillatus]|uniref:LysR family transcriptional regulator n=1 Tax=Streptomyces roseoverticillatus TaxID=66429 RepID=UPI0014700338|nr:LysR family transcriptional regulator [Streptomyces roseoverticillatus]